MESYADIMDKLASKGFNSWVVGGAVRDKLMGRQPKDYDLATDALPEQVLEIFPGSKYINATFSVAVYVPTDDGKYVEVVTLRKESNYNGGRPKDYEFVDDIKTDLARRDATINAMAMDINGGIIDPFGGQHDIQASIVRAVGDPRTRILEHPIRMMRYIRFSSTLGFAIDSKLEAEITSLSYQIGKETWEAISAELLKALDNKNAQMYLYMAQRYGILGAIIPEVDRMKGLVQNRHHNSDVWMHTLFAISSARYSTPMERLAILLHDVGKPDTKTYKGSSYGNSFHGHEVKGKEIAEEICDRLRLPKVETKLICDAVRWHMYPIRNKKTARKFVANMSHNVQDKDIIRERVMFALAVRRADRFAHKFESESAEKRSDEERRLVEAVLDEEQPFSVRDLAINGYDVMGELDIKPSKKVGEILSYLLDLVVSDSIGNNREDLIGEARKYYGESVA